MADLYTVEMIIEELENARKMLKLSSKLAQRTWKHRVKELEEQLERLNG